jgi:hypothetical protein
MIFINRNGLRWCDAPREYVHRSSTTTAGSSGATWGLRADVVGPESDGGEEKAVMNDATI